VRQRFVSTVLSIAAPLWLGCGVDLNQPMPVQHRYIVRAEFSGNPGPTCGARLRVGRFRVAPLFEREGLVFRRGEDDYATSFFDQFKRPPGVMLRGATLVWLRQAELFAEVYEPGDAGAPQWSLQARVRKLYADVRQIDAPSAVLEVEFSVADADTAEIILNRTYGQAPRAGAADADAMVLAWNRALDQILKGLEGDLRRMLDTRGLCN